MLLHYGLKLKGNSHEALGLECQDAFSIRSVGDRLLVAAIADGLGSCSRSAVGARLAAESATAYLAGHLSSGCLCADVLPELEAAFREALQQVKVAAGGEDLLDYSSTFTIVVYDGEHLAYGHVGDSGAIALTPAGDYQLITRQMKGALANETVPLSYGEKYWRFGYEPGPFCAIALMTDGLYEHICLPSLREKTPPLYGARVRPFIDRAVAPINTQEEAEEMGQEILTYFQTEPEARGTNDDLTLVCLFNQAIVPAEKEPDYYVPQITADEALNYQRRLYPSLEAKTSTTTDGQDSQECANESVAVIQRTTDPLAEGFSALETLDAYSSQWSMIEWAFLIALIALAGFFSLVVIVIFMAIVFHL